MNRKLLAFLYSCCLFIPVVASADSKSEKTPSITIEFGVAPQHAATDLSQRWTPVFEYLSRKTGYSIHFRTGKDVPTYQQQCIDGVYDVIYINPYHYAKLVRPKSGYTAFAQEKDGALVGALVVRQDSPYRTLQDLQGRDVAFPGRSAIVATLLPLEAFKSFNIELNIYYVSSHEAAFLAVAKGLFAAGGGDVKTFNTLKPDIRKQLRILWTAPPLPPLVFAAHPRVPETVVRRLQDTMIAMHKDPEGRELLSAIGFTGIVPARDADYDRVRKLNFSVPGQTP